MPKKPTKPTDADRLLCSLVADVPDAPPTLSRVDECAICHRAVWRALSSPPEPKAWCCHCALKNADRCTILEITRAQIADIAQVLKDQGRD